MAPMRVQLLAAAAFAKRRISSGASPLTGAGAEARAGCGWD